MSNFTVKVRDSVALGETERLYACDTIEVVWPGPARAAAGSAPVPGASNIFEAGIYLDPEPPQGFAPGDPNEGQVVRMTKHVVLFGGDHNKDAEERKGGKAWVMNEAGGTVATYEL